MAQSSNPSGAASVERLFGEVLTALEPLQAAAADAFSAGPVTAAAVVAILQPLAHELIVLPYIVGAGFVAAPGALADRELYLAWWQGDDEDLLAESDSAVSGAPLDYTRREWFRTPLRTGKRHITGPYVDFICSDEYVVTTTVPVHVGDTMVGVVGADMLMESVEEMILPRLVPDGATVVNVHNRVMVSADPTLPTGTLVETAEGVVPCGDLPISVARDARAARPGRAS